MAKPLWKVPSGNFAGWRRGDYLFDEDGDNVGYFNGDVAYSLNGDYIGEIYRDDWIGKKENVSHSAGSPKAGHAGISLAKYANRVGLAVSGWTEPNF